MILQRLYEDYERILKQTGVKEEIPSMYEMKPLRWIVEVPTDPTQPPRFLPLVGEGKKGQKGIVQPLPAMGRTSGPPKAILLADRPAYSLGVVFPNDLRGKVESQERERTRLKFEAFRELITECAKQTGDPDVAAVAEFLMNWDPDHPSTPLPGDMDGTQEVTFQVNHKLPITNPAVQRFWASRGGSSQEQSVNPNGTPATSMQCLVSGRFGPVEEKMPVPVRGVPNKDPARTQTVLVSANEDAFESYGLKRAQTSPISRDAGERFGKALNALLASPGHRVALQNVAYVFWAVADSTPKLFAFQPDPDPAEIRHLFEAVRVGRAWSLVPDAAVFHVFGLSANVARAVVRSAIETTVGEIGRNQAAWFRRLAIIGPDGEEGKPLGLKTLAVAPYRDFKEIAPGVEDALVQSALLGRPLPVSLLQAVVQRCRLDHEHRATHPRAALLKYFLVQDLGLPEDTLQEEVATDMPAAYHCGRLFAELEDIQQESARPAKINATIADKFFGSASSSPASVFGILLAGAQNHLAKLRKEREGAYHSAQKRLEEILAEISDFPTTLPLKEQALFSLGYYHHRAAKRKDIAERSAAKKRAAVDTDTAEEATL